MELTIQILLSAVGLICFLGGANLLLKGAVSFLPDVDISKVLVLDNLVRFLSGIYFSLGCLVTYVVFTINQQHTIVYFLGLSVIFSGLGRLISLLTRGNAGKYFFNIMIFEIILGISIMLSELFRI